ncbi:MAG: lipoate--protein ligase family protein [Actinomycetota bacterium]
MTGAWRLIVEDGVDAAEGLATDEYLMGGYAGSSIPPPTLRLYTYRTYCALIGRFQDPAAELSLDECAATGTQVNRRPTGGGAIIMGEDQLGLALVTSLRDPITPPHARAIVDAFARGILAGLSRLRITGELRGKNDIAVGGRKVAGLGMYADRNDAVLFHASILAGLDVEFMLRVLNIPAAKLAGKAISTVRERVTTVSSQTGRRVEVDEVRAHVAEGFEEAFGIRLESRPIDPEERAGAIELAVQKYGTPEWVMQRVAEAPAGSSIAKTAGGLLRICVGTSGEAIKDVMITGDFIAADSGLAELEAALRWVSAERTRVEQAVAEGTRRGGGLMGIEADVLSEAIWQAIVDARARRGSPGSCYYPQHQTNEEARAWR